MVFGRTGDRTRRQNPRDTRISEGTGNRVSESGTINVRPVKVPCGGAVNHVATQSKRCGGEGRWKSLAQNNGQK